ncbi:unnamed protein product, partial [Effrenium voratum]
YMGLRRDDLRPMQQLLNSELASLHAGYRRYFPLAELSLEGNPLEPPVLASISHALQQLSFREAPPLAQPELPSFGSLQPAQSLPDLREDGSMERVERGALSEGDIEDAVSIDVRPRAEIIREFQEDLQLLSAFLTTQRFHPRPDHDDAPYPSSRDSLEEGLGLPPTGPGGAMGVMGLAEIPDRASDFGFGPPVLPGTYSHTDSPEASTSEGPAQPPPPAPAGYPSAPPPPSPPARHARMQVLRNLLAESSDMPVEPVLRFALDLVSSETSLDTEAQLQQLMHRDREANDSIRRAHSV